MLSFLEEKAKAKDVHDQLHAIWYVSSLAFNLGGACITVYSGFASLRMCPALYCHLNKSSSIGNAPEMVSTYGTPDWVLIPN